MKNQTIKAMLYKSCLPLIVFILLINHSFSQSTINFYGTTMQVPVISSKDKDSIFDEQKLPVSITNYLNTTIRQYNLEDWAIVLFLNKYVETAFAGETDANKVKIMSVLLSAEKINNAVGTRDKDHLQVFISVKNELSPFTYTFEQNGYKLITIDNDKRPQQLKKVEIGFFKGKEIAFNGKTANLNITDYKTASRSFFNYNTNRQDSISFTYSQQFIKYSLDFPMLLGDKNYTTYPVSPQFTSTIFKALDSKIAYCKSRLDSINFLLRFAQTIVKTELNYITYGRNGYPAFPENTLVTGKGDSQDKAALFGFLFKRYFKTSEVVLLYYNDHLRVGLYDAALNTTDHSYIQFNGKNYFVADLTTTLPLGDSSYKLLKTPADISLN